MMSRSGLERRINWAMLASVMLAAEQQTQEASLTTSMSMRSDLRAAPLLISTAQFSLYGLRDAKYVRIVLFPDPGAPMMRCVGIFFIFLRSLDGIFMLLHCDCTANPSLIHITEVYFKGK